MRWLALLLMTLAAPLLQGGETSIVGPPSINYETVLRVLQLRPASPLIPYAQEIWAESQAANIDVAFALAIWLKESEFGTTGAATTTRNMGNLICEAADPAVRSGCSGRWATYASWPDAIGDWFAYVNRRYVAIGLTTVEALLPVYAPPSENDTALYIDQVTGWMREWGSGTVGMAPPGGGLTILEPVMEEWVIRPLDELQYSFWRSLAGILWFVYQAGLGLTDQLARLQRVLVTLGFRPAIGLIANGMLGISTPVFTLGMTVFFLCLIALPLGRVQQWVNARKLLFLMLLVPILFGVGVAGSLFQELEQLRYDVASIIYRSVFAAGDGSFTNLGQPAISTGQTGDTCALTPFNPTVSTALHGDAVAAAFVCADYEDVMDPRAAPPSDIPDEFETRFFFLDSTAFSGADSAQRDQQLANATAGVGRLVHGQTLVAFAVVERITDLLWTLGLGILFVGLLTVLIFSWFRPYEHLTTVLVFRIMQVFSTCWIISTFNALAMAVMLNVAEGMFAPLVLGIGLAVFALALVFLWIAGTTVFGALSASWTAMSGGVESPGPSAGSAMSAGRMVDGVTMAAGGAASGVGTMKNAAQDWARQTREGMRDHASNLMESKVARDMALRAGNHPEYAIAYASAQYRPLARIGALAVAMGAMSPEFEQGLYTAYRYTRGSGDLLNPQAQRMVGRDGARQKSAGKSSGGQTP